MLIEKDHQLLQERLNTVEAKLVARLGMETAVIAMENIDVEFYKRDYFLINYIEELIRKHFPYPNRISGSIATSRHMVNAKRAYVLILIDHLGIKKRQVASLLNCGWRNIYNIYNDATALLSDNNKSNIFRQRYNIILHEYLSYMKNTYSYGINTQA
jgi:hypothetical protein